MAAEEKCEEVSIDKEEAKIDKSTRRKGEVIAYQNRKGFGFINLHNEEEEEVKIFVHWKAVSSSDRWPRLDVGTEVEFFTGEHTDGRKFAADVTAVGGGELNYDAIAEPKAESTLEGKVIFYNWKKGYGFVELLEEVTFDEQVLEEGTNVHVGRENILSKDDCPTLRSGMTVKFSISKSSRGLSCMNVVNSNGEHISLPPEERKKRKWRRRKNNKNHSQRMYNNQIYLPQIGVIEKWNEDKGFGWITPNEDLRTKDAGDVPSEKKDNGQVYVHRNCVTGKIEEGSKVCFYYFFDRNRGVTATHVQQIDQDQTFTQNFVPSFLNLMIDEDHIPKIIGQKGKTIREIQKTSSTAINPQEVQEFYGKQQIINIMGHGDGIKKACQQILETIWGEKRDETAKITFVVHDVLSLSGRLAGENESSDGEASKQSKEKSNNIKAFQSIPGLTVNVTDGVTIWSQFMTFLQLEGNYDSVEQGMNVAVDLLVKLYFEINF